MLIQTYNQELNSNKTKKTIISEDVEPIHFNWNWISLKKTLIYKMKNINSRFVFKMKQVFVINDIQEYRLSSIFD